MKKNTVKRVEAALRTQIAEAKTSDNTDISHDRANLFDRYMGEPYGDEVDGRSSVVMSDVADTIEWIKPELLDIFTTGDKAAAFAPVSAEDVLAAEQETLAVNHVFYQQNNGFLVFYEWFTDALLQKNGYVRSDWDTRETVEISEYADLSAEELSEITSEIEAADGSFEILEQETEEAPNPALAEAAAAGVEIEQAAQLLAAAGQPLTLLRIKNIRIKSRRPANRYVIETVSPEDMEVSPRWRSISLTDAPYCAHRAERPVSWFVEMGFDRKQAEKLQDANDDDTEEEVTRFNVAGSTEHGYGDDADKSTREVVVRESYMRFDIDGDGRSELLKIWSGGEQGEILQWSDGRPAIEEVDAAPFSALTPIIVPHRHVGRSVAELVDDLQKIRTVLTRQMLDNVSMSNNAERVVYEDAIGEHTISDLLSTRVGKIIRADGPPGSIQYEVPPNLVPTSLQALEFIDGVRENRTGVTRYNQGLDADSLNKTASGITKILSASQKKILLIARIFAETGVKDLFRRIHRDLRRGPSKEMIVRMQGDYVPVDPREWAERDDVTISVGLGTGDKDAQLARLMALRQAQTEDAQFGLVGIEERERLNSKMVEVMGFKGAGFFKAAKQVEQAPAQPDPTQQMLEMQMAVEQQKAQLEMAKLRMDYQKALMEDDRKRDETNIRALTDIERARAQGDTAADVEIIRAMNQPPAAG